MEKILRVYKTILRMNIAYFTTYRANVYIGFISTIAWGLFQLIWVFLITNRISSSFGWSRNEITLFTFGFLLLTGFFHMFFSHNFDDMAHTINQGDLDTFLLRPVDSLFLLTTLRMRFTNLSRIALAIVVIVWWLMVNHISVSLWDILFYIVFFICGIILLYSIWVLFCTILIWQPNLTNLAEFLFSLNTLMKYPTEMFQNAGNIFLQLIVPLALVVATPIQFLMKKPSYPHTLLLVIFTIVFFIASRIFWRYALRHYTSVG